MIAGSVHNPPHPPRRNKGGTPRTDHMSRTNTTATRWRYRRRDTRRPEEAAAWKERSKCRQEKPHRNKTLKNKTIKPPQFLNCFINFCFLSSLTALCTSNRRSPPPSEIIFISSYIYTIQTERGNENSFSKDETQQELWLRREGTMLLGRVPTSQMFPPLPKKAWKWTAWEVSRVRTSDSLLSAFHSQESWRDRKKNPGPPLAGLVSSITKGQIPHPFLFVFFFY